MPPAGESGVARALNLGAGPKHHGVSRIGSEIQKWRVERGLSQRQLADRVGVARGIVSKIEAGVAPDPRASLLNRLAEALEVPAWALLGAAGPERGPDPRALLRELGLSMQRALPIMVYRAGPSTRRHGRDRGRAATEGKDGAQMAAWPYTPQPGEHGHEFLLFTVQGASMAPELNDGEDIFVDISEDALTGDRVVVELPDGTEVVRILTAVLGDAYLEAPGAAPIRLDHQMLIRGVVKEKRQRIQRGDAPRGRVAGALTARARPGRRPRVNQYLAPPPDDVGRPVAVDAAAAAGV